MKRDNILLTIYLLILLVGGSSFFIFEKSNRNPVAMEREEEEGEDEEKEQIERMLWIERMHRTAPGVKWRDVELKTRWDRYSRIKNMRLSQSSSLDTIANGALIGSWSEKGSLNQSGRIVIAEFDSINNLVYCGSAGGVVWKGNMNGTNWTPLNDQLKFEGINMLRFVQHGAVRRIVVATSGKPFVYTSDDNGATWNPATGLSNVASWGNVERTIVCNDSAKTIYMLANEWDYINWESMTSIYRSLDHGSTFSLITSYPSSVYGGADGFDIWTPRYGNTAPFMVHQNDTLLTTYHLNQTTGMPQQVSQHIFTSATKVLLTGFNKSPMILYVYSDKNISRSLDGGLTWTYRGIVTQNYFSRNGFSCSLLDSANLFFGGVEVYRSYNSASTWTRVNTWGSYYGNPASRLHADIPCIVPFLDGTEKQFIGTDGGLYISSDSLLSVNNISLSGLNVSQYYSTYTNRSDSNYIFAGAQDQGIQRCQVDTQGAARFAQMISGDYGHLVSADGGNSIFMVYPGFISYVANAPTNNNWWTADWDFNGATELWLPPLMADPFGASDICYLAGSTISLSGSHIIKLEVAGSTMNPTELPYDFYANSGGGYVSAMDYSPLNNSYWYAATDNGNFFYSNDAGQNWTMTAGFNGPDPHYFYGSAIHASQTQPGKVFIAGSGYNNPAVYVSIDSGQTFAACDSGLPPTLILELAADTSENFLFAATEAGPYVYVTTLNQWFSLAVNGHAPDQTYWSVDFVPQTNTARFGTYGRGIWDFKIATPLQTSVPLVANANKLNVFPNPTRGKFELACDTEISSTRIIDMNGKLVYQSNVYSKNIDISTKPKGLYFVSVESEGKKYTKKILLQ